MVTLARKIRHKCTGSFTFLSKRIKPAASELFNTLSEKRIEQFLVIKHKLATTGLLRSE